VRALELRERAPVEELARERVRVGELHERALVRRPTGPLLGLPRPAPPRRLVELQPVEEQLAELGRRAGVQRPARRRVDPLLAPPCSFSTCQSYFAFCPVFGIAASSRTGRRRRRISSASPLFEAKAGAPVSKSPPSDATRSTSPPKIGGTRLTGT